MSRKITQMCKYTPPPPTPRPHRSPVFPRKENEGLAPPTLCGGGVGREGGACLYVCVIFWSINNETKSTPLWHWQFLHYLCVIFSVFYSRFDLQNIIKSGAPWKGGEFLVRHFTVLKFIPAYCLTGTSLMRCLSRRDVPNEVRSYSGRARPHHHNFATSPSSTTYVLIERPGASIRTAPQPATRSSSWA